MLMQDHLFAEERYKMAYRNVTLLSGALAKGDIETFIQVTEQEALTLHALLMSSNPSYILLKPNTISLIKKIVDFRKANHIPVCFTMDAGPNIHLLYPGDYEVAVKDWIKKELTSFLEDGQWLDDMTGSGPVYLYK